MAFLQLLWKVALYCGAFLEALYILIGKLKHESFINLVGTRLAQIFYEKNMRTRFKSAQSF